MPLEIRPELCPDHREYCYRCRRAKSMCLCALLHSCANRTRVHILQHRRESKHAFNTVHLLRLGLKNLVVHDLPTDCGRGFAIPKNFPRDAGVLYPAEHSTDLAELSAEATPSTLVVVDGTWDQAHRIYRDNAWLRQLRPYRLSPSEPSRYRIRKEPSAECLSTLESTLMALRHIEPETKGFDAILHAFDTMNEQQLASMAQHEGAPKRVKRQRLRAMRAVPAPLWDDPAKVVVVYGESALPYLHRHKQDRELAQWCAVRLQDYTQIFSEIAQTQGSPPSGNFLRDLGWTAQERALAIPLDLLQQRWRAFIRPGDTVVAWNKSTLRMARQHQLIEHGIVLKTVYGNTTSRAFGTLENVIAHDGLRPHQGWAIPGRAANRLANAQCAALALGQWARERQEDDRLGFTRATA